MSTEPHSNSASNSGADRLVSVYGAGGDGAADAPNPAMVVARRRASVNLRGESEGGVGAMMDPANQSLADALKVTYRLLQVGMIALVVIFVLSGFQSIKNYERGVRVTFGKVETDDLQPGFAFSWPRPLGEIIRVPTGTETADLRRVFSPNINPNDADKSLADAAPSSQRGELDPKQDGYVVTGDLNVGHLRFSAEWMRTSVRQNVQNVRADDERKMVETMLMRGAVHAASQLSIDELVSQQSDAARSRPMPDMAETIRRLANEALASAGSGIEVTRVSISERQPPLMLIANFAEVQRSQTTAQKDLEKARQDAVERTSRTAGEASDLLLKQIDAYDALHSAGKQAEAEAVLATIYDLLEKGETTIDGQKVTARVTGEAGTVIAEAQRYRSTVVSRAKGELDSYNAKLAVFEANAPLLLVGEWTDAYQKFLSRENVDVWMLSPGVGTLQVLLNRDPALERERERSRLKSEAAAIEAKRAQELENARNDRIKSTAGPQETR